MEDIQLINEVFSFFCRCCNWNWVKSKQILYYKRDDVHTKKIMHLRILNDKEGQIPKWDYGFWLKKIEGV